MHLSLSLALGSPTGLRGYNPITALGDDLLEWWEAGEGMTLVGSAVSAWEGRKNGYTVSQGLSAARPVYSATGLNGAPGLTFDGTDDCLAADSVFSLPVGANGAEVWAVLQQDADAADTTSRAAFTYGGATNTDRRIVIRVVESGVNRARIAVGNGSSSPGVTGTTIAFSARHLLRAVITEADVRMDVDGNLSGEVAAVPATGSTRTRIGANTGSTAGNFWHGRVRDILVTNILSDATAAELQTFLLARRAL